MADVRLRPELVPEWQMPYWDSLRDHDVKVQRCATCGTYRHHPKEICARCAGMQWSWVSIDGGGVIYSYTVIRRAPTPAYEDDVPYGITHVTMDEGFRMIGRIDGVDVDDVQIGMRVRVAYEQLDEDWTLLGFSPDPPRREGDRSEGSDAP